MALDIHALLNQTKPEDDITTILSQRIRTMFAEVLPEPILRKAVDEQIRWFMSPEPEPVYNPRVLGGVEPAPKPTKLQLMIRQILAQRLKGRVSTLLDEMVIGMGTEEDDTRETLDAMVTRLAPGIWKTVMDEMVVNSVRALQQDMRRQ